MLGAFFLTISMLAMTATFAADARFNALKEFVFPAAWTDGHLKDGIPLDNYRVLQLRNIVHKGDLKKRRPWYPDPNVLQNH